MQYDFWTIRVDYRTNKHMRKWKWAQSCGESNDLARTSVYGFADVTSNEDAKFGHVWPTDHHTSNEKNPDESPFRFGLVSKIRFRSKIRRYLRGYTYLPRGGGDAKIKIYLNNMRRRELTVARLFDIFRRSIGSPRHWNRVLGKGGTASSYVANRRVVIIPCHDSVGWDDKHIYKMRFSHRRRTARYSLLSIVVSLLSFF